MLKKIEDKDAAIYIIEDVKIIDRKHDLFAQEIHYKDTIAKVLLFNNNEDDEDLREFYNKLETENRINYKHCFDDECLAVFDHFGSVPPEELAKIYEAALEYGSELFD